MRPIFVFGSNEAGRHGLGAAAFALRECGAIYGQGEGLQGHSYAIPTKDSKIKTLDLDTIRDNVRRFVAFAKSRPDLEFNVTPVGTGLAGIDKDTMWSFFKGYEKLFGVTNLTYNSTWFDGGWKPVESN